MLTGSSALVVEISILKAEIERLKADNASLVDAANKMAAELEDAEDRLAARGTDESKTPPDRS